MTAPGKATLVTAVEVRCDGDPPMTIWEMPVKVETRQGLTALVFWVMGGETAVTVLLSESDKRDLINLLRRKA